MNSEITLRRATDADARPAADVWLRSFTAALPSVRCAHDEDDVRTWFTRVLVPKYETWVAVTGTALVGVLVLNGPELRQLYLAPECRGRGLGDRFISLAKKQRPDGLLLWTFQVNASAQPGGGLREQEGGERGEGTRGEGGLNSLHDRHVSNPVQGQGIECGEDSLELPGRLPARPTVPVPRHREKVFPPD